MINDSSINNSSNKPNSQLFYGNYSVQDKLTDSQETVITNSINDTIKIQLENNDEKEKNKKKILGLNKIDYYYKFVNEIQDQENIGIPLDIEIEKDKDDNEIDSIDESFNEFLYNYKDNDSKIQNIFKSLIKIDNQKIFRDSYFRFPYEKKEKEKTVKIYCIPKVILEKFHIIFILDNEKICLDIEEMLKLIAEKELFINKNEDILNQAYYCQIHNKKYEKYCTCENNICELCLKNEHICHKEKEVKNYDLHNLKKFKFIICQFITYNIQKINFYKREIKNIIKELSNNKYSNVFQDKLNIKLNIIFTKMKKKIILYIYFSIIKDFIVEMVEISKEKKEKYNYNISLNLISCKNFIKSKKKRPKRKNNGKDYSRINYLIPFYSDENINDNFKQHLYIGVSLKGFIIILYFNFFKIKDNYSIDKDANSINNNILVNNDFFLTNQWDNTNIYTIINSKDLEKKAPFKIKRIEKCFEKYNYIQGKIRHTFLVSFPSAGNSLEGIAKIIRISDDYKEIEILKTIYDYKGLLNAIEINFNNNYYLLSCTIGFTLCYYNSDTKDIVLEEIIPQRKDNKDTENNMNNKIFTAYKNITTYKELLFIEKRQILIVQVNFPDQYIFFYNINNDSNRINIIFLDQIKINKEDPYFSESPFNSCIINDKYLLIGTKVDKIEKKNNIKKQIKKENNNEIKEIKINKAGFYIINLDIIFNNWSNIDKAIQINYLDFCKELYCISHIKENMFICTFKVIQSKNYKEHFSINTYEILEKNGIIHFNKKYFKNGIFKNINSSKLIDDSFIICSNKEYNQLLKIDKNGEIYYYFDIKINY